jgi:hypothetical protein
MLGAGVARSGVDTSQFGGSPDATVDDAEIEEVTPDGKLVWKWDSGDHIGPAETGRWWPTAIAGLPGFSLPGNGVVHWNSLDVRGHAVLLSFRHLDAIYKISRETGHVDWKLGGTETAKSLRVLNDPHGDYPLGGRHDARFGPTTPSPRMTTSPPSALRRARCATASTPPAGPRRSSTRSRTRGTGTPFAAVQRGGSRVATG